MNYVRNYSKILNANIINNSSPVKNVVLAGFGNITLLDLDTIDLSNLNRQFLFRKKDVKQSKAMVSGGVAFASLKADFVESGRSAHCETIQPLCQY